MPQSKFLANTMLKAHTAPSQMPRPFQLTKPLKPKELCSLTYILKSKL